MKITITINTDNAAFEDYGLESEVARILKRYASELEDGLINVSVGPRNLHDINGNAAGKVTITGKR